MVKVEGEVNWDLRELRLMWPRILYLGEGFCGLRGGGGLFCILYHTSLKSTSRRLVYRFILAVKPGREHFSKQQHLEDG